MAAERRSEPEARIAGEIFEKAAQGWGYIRLATFARQNAPSKRQPTGTDKAYRWTPGTIKRISNRARRLDGPGRWSVHFAANAGARLVVTAAA